MSEELPDVEPWISNPTEGEYSVDWDEGTPYDIGYKVDNDE